jgi:hypothetical protein
MSVHIRIRETELWVGDTFESFCSSDAEDFYIVQACNDKHVENKPRTGVRFGGILQESFYFTNKEVTNTRNAKAILILFCYTLTSHLYTVRMTQF